MHFITDTKWIRNSDLWIGRSKMNIRRIRHTIFTFAKPEKTNSFALFRSIEALTFSDSGSDSDIASIASLFACLFRVFFHCSPPHGNIYSTTILVNRRTAHMWNKQTRQASAILRVQNSDVIRAALRKLDPKATKTNRAHFKTRCLTARVISSANKNWTVVTKCRNATC